MVNDNDSLTFYFHDKPTLKFSISSVTDPNHFDIALRITVKGKYSTLKEVIVRTRSYRLDSMENRLAYKDVFDYHRPGLASAVVDGVAGGDLDEIINMFRFKRNKRLRKFQERLEGQEKEKYIDYRFNKNLIRRITQLQGALLDTFMVRYRPPYEFLLMAGELQFNQYVLESLYEYKANLPKLEAKKESQ